MINKTPLSIMLFFSILINTFLLGVMISFFVMRPNHMPPPPNGGSPLAQIEQAKDILSPEGRAIVDQVLEDQKKKVKDDMHGMMKLMDKARNILTAPDFDPAVLEALHKKMGVHDANMKQKASQIISDIAVKLSSDERIRLFGEVLSHPPPNGPNGSPPHEGRRPPPMHNK